MHNNVQKRSSSPCYFFNFALYPFLRYFLICFPNALASLDGTCLFLVDFAGDSFLLVAFPAFPAGDSDQVAFLAGDSDLVAFPAGDSFGPRDSFGPLSLGDSNGPRILLAFLFLVDFANGFDFFGWTEPFRFFLINFAGMLTVLTPFYDNVR